MNIDIRMNPPKQLKTAVLFLVFNRPEVTARVFETIRQAKPPRLYVAADGPRIYRPGEAELCDEVRRIATNVDWPCEVKTLFRASNLGCKTAVSEGINWFFDCEESGIVLEDDCLPHPDFFRFCDELLDRFSDDLRVSAITGNNFQNGQKRGDEAYYFSKYNHCWGWATWRRSWRYYRGDIPFWPEWHGSDEWYQKIPDKFERRYWEKIFNQVYSGQIDSWAYPWTCSVWYHGGLTATPNVNLVTNIGFGAEATHTTSSASPQAEISRHPLGSMTHPSRVEQDDVADRYVFDHTFGGKNMRFPYSLIAIPRRLAGKLYRRIYAISKLIK